MADLERRNSQLEAQTRSFNSTIRTAESSAKTLRDETIRLKTLLAQVRSQSANDIRKRDMQLQRMKERLLDTRRGSRPTPSTIVVKGPQTGSNLGRSYDELGESTTSSSKELSDETAEFLTTLSQTLADENDNFLALFRYCLSTLKAVQGLPDYDHIPQNEEEEEDTMNPVVATPANFDALNQELEVVLGSLQDMLHQPSYVPVEELAEKEEEIIQLKNRNDILYAEWKKAIDLVDGWNAALVETVDNSRDELSPPPNTVPASRRKSKGRVEDIRAREVSEAAEAQVLRDHQSVIKRAERRRTAGAAELEAEAELAPEAGPEEYEEVEQHGDEEYEEQESDLILEPRREDTPLPETLEEEATEPSAELEEPSAELKEPVPDPEEEAPKPEEEAPELEEDPAPELEKVLEKEPTHEDSSDAEEAESLLPPTPPDDRVIYEEEVIHVRTKPPASSPLPRSRPRTRQQTILGPDIVGMKSEPEEYATSKKRRRSSRVVSFHTPITRVSSNHNHLYSRGSSLALLSIHQHHL